MATPPVDLGNQIDKRIDGIQETVKRARNALFICILAAGAMFLCLWNTYASWDRDFAFLDKEDFRRIDPAYNESDQESGEKIEKTWAARKQLLPPSLMEHQMRSWVDTQVVSVALLGIKISVSDFAFLGSLALSICSFYLLLCSRRENHEIGYLFQNIKDLPREYLQHSFAMVNSFMVFNLSGVHSGRHFDAVIDSLEPKDTVQKIPGIRKAASIIYFLPAITMIFTIICDFGWTFTSSSEHLFFTSPFRPHPEKAVYCSFDPWEKTYFWFFESVATIVAVTLFRMSLLIRKYENGTRSVLDEVYGRLFPKTSA
jgi:hypothetical protein